MLNPSSVKGARLCIPFASPVDGSCCGRCTRTAAGRRAGVAPASVGDTAASVGTMVASIGAVIIPVDATTTSVGVGVGSDWW
jgi:hypothetical protein